MEIYQLRYFVAVAETGNFTKAAAHSNVSQPSLSQQIINLEEELNQKLFHRLGRQVILTDAGHILLERARRIIAEADNTIQDLREDPALGYRVSVGAIPTVAHFFLPAVLAYCRENDVRIRLQSREDFRLPIVNGVVEGEFDWGVMSLPHPDPRLEITPLFREPLLLGVAASHPLAKQEKVTFDDFREQNFIMLGDASSLTTQILQRISGELDFSPAVTHRCAQIATLKSLTAMGLGISILPRSARNANDPEGLVYRKISGSAFTRDVGLVRHRRRHLSKGAKLFADAAAAVVGPLGGLPPAAPAT
ncbi:MAG TPA: LysR family transcriptional regulator [Candidatus Didemnitutus sp.]|nr:LysR family transcriptional regulator [Candidatus Didemnitutus sp.]